MAVKLSREPGRCSLLLKQAGWLDPALIAPELSRVLKLPRSDAVRACRLQRGILFEGALPETAELAANMLSAFGFAAVVVPDDEVPLLPRPVNVSLAHIEEAGLGTPSVTGTGLPKLWPWGELAMIAAGILIDPAAQSAGLFERIEESGFSDAQDRQTMAASQLEKAQGRVFPLRAEIAGANSGVAQALEAALQGRAPSVQRAVDGFGNIGTALDLVFLKPFERLRITHKGRVTGIEHSTSHARNLHLAVKEITTRAPGATQTGAALAMAQGADSGDYVFEDLAQLDNYCRWAYYWRLRGLQPLTPNPAAT